MKMVTSTSISVLHAKTGHSIIISSSTHPRLHTSTATVYRVSPGAARLAVSNVYRPSLRLRLNVAVYGVSLTASRRAPVGERGAHARDVGRQISVSFHGSENAVHRRQNHEIQT